MALGRLWAGRIFGTNVGNVFAKLEGSDDALTGTLRFADTSHGVVVYEIAASFDGSKLSMAGTPTNVPEGIVSGKITVEGTLDAKGSVHGEWESELGTGGTFVLFPHDPANEQPDLALASAEADQLHTKRYSFGAIEINKDGLVRIGERLQADFPGRKVVVTITAATEQSRFLEDFRYLDPPYEKVEVAKLFVQVPELGGVNRSLAVEFGPFTNFVMAQSSDEAWTLGIVERMERDLQPYQRTLAINIRRAGIGVNQLLVFWAIVFLVDIQNLWLRAGFLLAVLAVVATNQWIHNRYIPLATIRLGSQKLGIFSRLGPSTMSWAAALLSGVVVSIISAVAKGWLRLS